jgi:hypothetical protein
MHGVIRTMQADRCGATSQFLINNISALIVYPEFAERKRCASGRVRKELGETEFRVRGICQTALSRFNESRALAVRHLRKFC